jgi:hypothetical protein
MPIYEIKERANISWQWTVLLDEHSYNLMPIWLRPVPAQLMTPHAMWIDRIPWLVIFLFITVSLADALRGQKFANI